MNYDYFFLNLKDNHSFFLVMGAFNRLLKYYYSECPGSIMPLLLLFLAKESTPDHQQIFVDEKIRKPLDWKKNPEDRYVSPVLAEFTKADAKKLAIEDPAGKHMLERWECNEMNKMSIVVFPVDERVKEIRSYFQKRDEKLGSNYKKRKALFFFAQGLLSIPQYELSENFLPFAYDIINEAKVVKDFEDFDIAMLELWMCGNDFSGSVYAPLTKVPLTVANMIDATIETESIGNEAELLSMINYLLIKGNGCKQTSCASVDKILRPEVDKIYDLVIMNSPLITIDNKKEKSDWHECLKYVKNNLSETGRYIGLVENKHLFAMLNKQQLFTEFLNNKELDQIILLPKKYGYSLVTTNKAKENPEIVLFVNLYNENISFCGDYDYQRKINSSLFERNKEEVYISELIKPHVKIEDYFGYSLPEKDGFELAPLRWYLRRITPSSSFCVNNYEFDDTIYIINYDSKAPYSRFAYEICSERVETYGLYRNYYYLDSPSLIVNREGALNARLYIGNRCKDNNTCFTDPAYLDCKEALAFAINPNKIYPEYIINELRKEYVKTQLQHWKCSSEEIHSEDEILDIKIYVPVPDEDKFKDDELDIEMKICEGELDKNILPVGKKIRNKRIEYKIIKYIDRGAFGIVYLAERNELDKVELVALKEYMPQLKGIEGLRGENDIVTLRVGSAGEIRQDASTYTYLKKFVAEADLMKSLSQTPGSKISRVSDVFACDETNTLYYEMQYYPKGTLIDFLNNIDEPLDEEVAINKIIIPIAQALNTLHANNLLYLDLKPDNILLDNKEYAVLGDLGICIKYNDDGKILSQGTITGTENWACKKQFDFQYLKDFHPQLDIYSLGAIYALLITGCEYHKNFEPEKIQMDYTISSESKNAIIAALDPNLKTTPSSVTEFVRMLPGCKDIDLNDISPRCDFD